MVFGMNTEGEGRFKRGRGRKKDGGRRREGGERRERERKRGGIGREHGIEGETKELERYN